MPRGGRRQGRPGATYPNRTDLNAQPVRTAPGQPYGAAKAQQDAQRAMPLPQVGGGAPSTATAGSAAPVDPTGGLYDDSMRADEPVQAGLATGPGAGPTLGPNTRDILLAAYRRFPTDEMRQLIERMG